MGASASMPFRQGGLSVHIAMSRLGAAKWSGMVAALPVASRALVKGAVDCLLENPHRRVTGRRRTRCQSNALKLRKSFKRPWAVRMRGGEKQVQRARHANMERTSAEGV